jgi:predicted aspartyl protease
MTRYPVEQVGSLLLTKAAVSGPAGMKVVRLLVDTGSVYTILPVQVLESIVGMDFLRPLGAKLLLAEGVIEVP